MKRQVFIALTCFSILCIYSPGATYSADRVATQSRIGEKEKTNSQNHSYQGKGQSTARTHRFFVHVSQPYSLIADAGQDVAIAEGEGTVLGGSPSGAYGYGDYSYQWIPSDYLDDPTLPNPTATPPKTMSYQLIVADGNNCTSSSFVEVTVIHPEPELEFTINEQLLLSDGDYAYCSGTGVFIHLSAIQTGTPPFNMILEVNGVSNTYTGVDLDHAQLYHETPAAGIHTVVFTQIIDATGTAVDSPELRYHTVFEIWELPEAVITADNELAFCDGGMVVLTASEAAEYLWSNGETTQSITVTQSGVFTVTVTDVNGCSATSEPIEVTVHPLPEVFCPGDFSIRLRDPQIELSGSDPIGGFFEGKGVSNGYFNPWSAGVGTWTITYEYQDETTACVNSCTFEIEVINDTGIRESRLGDIIVYPNPANSVLHIEAQQLITKVHLYNLQGQLIHSFVVNSQNYMFGLENINKGIYLLQVFFENGVASKKVQID